MNEQWTLKYEQPRGGRLQELQAGKGPEHAKDPVSLDDKPHQETPGLDDFTYPWQLCYILKKEV